MTHQQTLPPPFLPTPTIDSLRSVGGFPITLPTSASSTSTTSSPSASPSASASASLPLQIVRPDILYRSADPSNADASALALLREKGVDTVFDLRSRPEIERAGGGVWVAERGGEGGVRTEEEVVVPKRVWTPVFADEDYSPERLGERYKQYAGREDEGFVKAYTDILTHAGPAYRTILLHLANTTLPPPSTPHPPPACLVHCTAGKDRTGVLIGLVLALLGVDDATIAAEYHLTEPGLAHRKDAAVQKLASHPAFAAFGGPGQSGREAAERMVGAKKVHMLNTLAMIRERWGSAEACVREVCGLTKEEVRRVRELLTVTVGEEGFVDGSAAAAAAAL